MASRKPASDAQLSAKALEALLATGYIDKKRLYLENFLRGVFFSIGTILGATIGIALLLWILSLFNNVPLVGDVVKNVQQSVNSAKN